MKKFGFFLFAVLGLIACGDDNNDPTPEQHVTCSISAPAEGATVNIAEKMTIKGEATIDFGEISNVTLKVGGKAISEVTAVPFSYDYTFEANQAEGTLKIELTVKGDQGTMATSEVNITLTKPEPTPEPGEGEMVDSRDNHVYKTVEIGEQTWMAENLAYLPKVNKPITAIDCEGEPLYYVLNYDGEDVSAAKNTSEYKLYGALYNWYAAMNKENAEGSNADAIPSGIQGICPNGWHLPSKAEWKKLEDFVASELEPVKGNVFIDDFGGETFDDDCKNVWSALAGIHESKGWGDSGNSDTNPDLANGPRNTYGFNVLPAGQCYQTGEFGRTDGTTNFWTTDLQSSGGGNIMFSNLNYNLDYSKYGAITKRGYSVRCVKD
ncbi:FISUMP domain-containing protein [Bacteroides caecimuris]|uniref:FISUMP domain-containing protein n=1 Tax=Bacteroides caecimuris TaxID=1796613 RepID=UPI0025738EE2|nr:FISUMP domain-containing protein [Bacteroides caecimuris]